MVDITHKFSVILVNITHILKKCSVEISTLNEGLEGVKY